MSIFLKSKIQELYDPEQLDQQLHLVYPSQWLTLLIFFILFAGLLLWGIFGKIRTQITGTGILLPVTGTLIYQRQPENSPLEAVLYLPPDTHLEKIKQGLPVEIYLGIPPREELGFVYGHITKVIPFPASAFIINQQLNNETLTQFFLKNGSPYILNVALDLDNRRIKKNVTLNSGMLCSARIIIKQQSPMSWLLGH